MKSLEARNEQRLEDKERRLSKNKQKKILVRKGIKSKSLYKNKSYCERKRRYRKKYYRQNRDKILDYQKKIRIQQRKQRKVQKAKQKREEKKLKILNKKIIQSIRARIISALKLKGNIKSERTIQLIGCSINELRKYLESQFKEGMNWDNHGKGINGNGMKEWQVDHIKPCASFDLSKPEEQRKCFHYSNLQPLWAEENRKKNSIFENIRYTCNNLI
jgi:hypothetical protein